MAAPDVRKALRVNGRLCWGPTDLSGTYPFGGVGLGFAKGKAHRIRSSYHTVRAEEFAGMPVDATYPAEEHIFSAVLSAYDSDAIAALFPDVATGATTGRQVISTRVSTDAKRAGLLLSSLADVLYFSPDSDSHPGVLFYNALPMRAEAFETAYNLAAEWGMPMLFLATPNADGNVVDVGLREDLSV